ncbi:MAG: flagellar basal body L-ring protein FlgH [Acidobacteria bacterium]|nr:flagellar basal body L-ring protein FlgH [Acidobacteriota bacterium]
MIHKRSTYWVSFILGIVLSSAMAGCTRTSVQVNDPTELKDYIESAKRRSLGEEKAEGSLWSSSGRQSNLFRDLKAHNIDDVVTILVSESTQALASADASNSRSTSASAGFDNLFGLEKSISELPTMVSGESGSSFEGQGSTSRQTTLSANLTARVVDVLPNGYLVVEGMREIHVNNENQSLYLSGVIRPEDISPNNIVPSSAVAQMSVRLEGRGVVSQPIKPGWLYKILNGVLPF